MLTSLARFLVRRRVAVLCAAVVAVAVCGILGSGVARNLTSGGLEDPNAPSSRAAELLERDFSRGNANLLLLVTAPAGVDDPAVARAGLALTDELRGEAGIVDVRSYWSLGAPPLASTDRTKGTGAGPDPG